MLVDVGWSWLVSHVMISPPVEAGRGPVEPRESLRPRPQPTIITSSQCSGAIVVMSARRKRYEEEGDFGIPGLGDRNYRPGELAGPAAPAVDLGVNTQQRL